MKLEDIRYTTSDQVAYITIARPEKRNALRTQTYRELRTAVVEAAEDDEVGVIVLAGEGDEAFCAGGDVSQQNGRTILAGRKHLQHVVALGDAMRSSGKPIVAAVRERIG